MTVLDLIKQILLILNVQSEIQAPTNEQLLIVRDALNRTVTSIVENKSITFWREQQETIMLPAAPVVYSSSSTYNVGDIVQRSDTDSTRYINRVAISSGEEFSLDKWAVTTKTFTLGSDYYDLNDYIAVKSGSDFVELNSISSSDYLSIQNKEKKGFPEKYALFYNPDFSVDVHIYPQPSDQFEVTFAGILKTTAYTSNNDTLVESSSLLELIKYLVAQEVMLIFGVTDVSDLGRSIVARAKQAEKQLSTRNTRRYVYQINNTSIGV